MDSGKLQYVPFRTFLRACNTRNTRTHQPNRRQILAASAKDNRAPIPVGHRRGDLQNRKGHDNQGRELMRKYGYQKSDRRRRHIPATVRIAHTAGSTLAVTQGPDLMSFKVMIIVGHT